MHPSLLRKLLALVVAAAAMTLVQAQERLGEEAPEIRESAGIRYVSGGIGIDDVKRMRALAPGFNIRLRFADASNGSSLSDVVVVVLNQKNERLVRLSTEGPLLYMKMPPGRYLFAMAYKENVRQRQVTVGRASQQLTIGFPVNDVDLSWRQGHDHAR